MRTHFTQIKPYAELFLMLAEGISQRNPAGLPVSGWGTVSPPDILK